MDTSSMIRFAWPYIYSGVRHGVSGLGALLVGVGMTQWSDSTVNELAGSGMFLIGLGLSWVEKRKLQKQGAL